MNPMKVKMLVRTSIDCAELCALVLVGWIASAYWYYTILTLVQGCIFAVSMVFVVSILEYEYNESKRNKELMK